MAALSKRGNLSTPELEEGQRKANRTQTQHLALLLAARRRSATCSCWTTRARPAISSEEAQWPQVRRHLQDSALKVSFTKYKLISITIWAPTRQTKLFEQRSPTQAFLLPLEVLEKRQDQGLPVPVCLQGRDQVGLCGGDARTSLQCERLRANPNIWGYQQLPPVRRMLSKCP